jgi:hypothetical protein
MEHGLDGERKLLDGEPNPSTTRSEMEIKKAFAILFAFFTLPMDC